MANDRTALTQAVAGLGAERDVLLSEKQALAQAVAELEAEREALRTLVTAVQAERDGLLAEKRALAQTVAELEAEREALRTLVTAVEVEREHLSTEFRRLSVQRDALMQTAVEKGSSELTEIRRALAQAVAELEAEREVLRTLVTAVEAEREHFSTELRRLAVQRDTLIQTAAEKGRSELTDILSARLNPQIAALLVGQETATARILRGLESWNNGQRAHRFFDAQRYLGLLELTLTGMIYCDEATNPESRGVYDPGVRATGRDWPSRAHTMIGLARVRNLRALCEQALEENIPGDFIETGVWRGGACILMRGILQAYCDPQRRVFVADSFRGLPPPNPMEYSADENDAHHTYEQLAVSREEVEENFRRYGLLDDRVVFLEGWFKDTLPAAPIDRLSVLRLDGDMYESTIQALDALYDKVSPGGFVIIDDYILKPCAKAVDHFREIRGITAPMKDIDGAAVWWRVPA